MTTRQFSDEERSLAEKNMKRWLNERLYQQYLLEHATLMLSQGLEQNYLFQRRKFEMEKKGAAKQLQEIDFTILTLRRQLENGVEMIEQKGDKK